MKQILLICYFALLFVCTASAQVFPNPQSLSTGQGTPGSIDPMWTVSPWYTTNPPNPIGLNYIPALINNSCAPGAWAPPTGNANWITGSDGPCSSNYNAGYRYFRLTLNLPADCNGNSIATAGNYVLYFTGYADNTISNVYVNGTATNINGGSYSSPLTITLAGPWLAGINYVDVLVYNFPNSGNLNPYGLLLEANSSANNVDTDGDGVPDINDQCPCLVGLPGGNGCPPVSITGDTVICNGQNTTLTGGGGGTFLWSNGATTPTITVNPTGTTRYSLVETLSNGYVDSAVVYVTVNPLPAVSINPSTAAICTGGNVTLTANGAATYVWSTGAVTNSINVSPGTPTTYTVTGTNPTTCSATATSLVTVYPLPTPAINAPVSEICVGGNATLTASGGSTYVWDNASQNAAISVTPISTITYAVTVTDVNNCSATTSQIITVDPLPTAAITPANPAICSGDSATLTASGGALYAWSNLASTTSITVSPTNTSSYTVTVTDRNTCSASISTSVTVNQLPVAAINPVASGVCLGGGTTFTASGGATYVWSNNSSSTSIAVSPANTTTYIVTVTDTHSCTATASAQIAVNALPVPVINPATQTICAGVNTSLTASGGNSYLWNNGASTVTISANSSTTAVYTVTVTDLNTCTASISATVTVIAPMNITATATNISCNGATDGAINTIVNSGQSPYSYAWNTGATTASPAGLAAANYSVTVTDNAGCTATSSATITEPATLQLTSTFTNPACADKDDGVITLNVTGGTAPYQYKWSNGDASANLLNLAPGSYAVTVNDANNCTTNTSFNLAYLYDFSIQTNPGVTLKLGQSTSLGYTLIGTAGNITNSWSPAEAVSCSNCAAPTTATNVTTFYKIEVKNDLGCIATDTVTITIVPDYTVFVPNAFTPNNDGNNDYFRIYGDIAGIAFLQIQIYDRIGEKVFESEDANFAWDGTFKSVFLGPSVYSWQMKITYLDGHRTEMRKGTVTLMR